MLNRFDIASMLQASDAPLSANASRRSGLLASSALVAFGLCLCLIALIISSNKIDSVYAVSLKPYVSVKEYAAQKIPHNPLVLGSNPSGPTNNVNPALRSYSS